MTKPAAKKTRKKRGPNKTAPPPVAAPTRPANLPSPEEIRDSRRQSLLQKHVDGVRLTPDQLKEIEELIGFVKSTIPVYDSQTQAATSLNIPIKEIKRAKQNGCIAFRNTKIYTADLLAWLKANPIVAASSTSLENSTEDVNCSDAEMESRKLRAQTLKAELELDIAKSKVINRELVRTEWSTNVSAIFEILDKSLDRSIYNAVVKEVKIYLGKKVDQSTTEVVAV